MPVALEPIGIVHSCFKEKFGIPRQAGLVREARATLELLPPFDRPEAVRGLESFSHIWIVFIFHANCRQSWKPTVRPPRLGGNRRMGVFASRSGFRPNPLGISAVELAALRFPDNRVVLDIRGGDLLDGTPVVRHQTLSALRRQPPRGRHGLRVGPGGRPSAGHFQLPRTGRLP